MSYIEYDGLTSPNEVLEKMADYIKKRGYTIIQDYTDDANIYDRSSNDGKKLVFQDKNNEYFIHLRSANGTNIFGTNDDAQMDVASFDKDSHYYGIGLTVSEGYSKAQRWYNQFNAPLKFRDKDVQAVFMPVTQGTSVTPVKRPTKVDYPTPVDEPVKPDYPKAPVKDPYPTKPVDPSTRSSYENASSNRRIAPRITNISGTNPFTLKRCDIDTYGGNGVPLADLLYDSSHQYNNDIVMLFDNNSMRVGTSGTVERIESGNEFNNRGMYVNGTGKYPNEIYVFEEPLSTLTEQTFMDEWNRLPEMQKQTFSVGDNFNFPFFLLRYRKTGNVNYSIITGSVGPAAPGVHNGIIGIAMPKTAFEKLKNFSQTVSQYQQDLDNYNTQVQQIDDAYNAAYAKYQQQCNEIDEQYNGDVATYNQYLQDVQKYNDYLEAEENYIKYLTQKNATGYVYNLYCNEVTKPTDTLAFSLVKQATRVVDKIENPPTKPTPPVKPVKAPYPNEPTYNFSNWITIVKLTGGRDKIIEIINKKNPNLQVNNFEIVLYRRNIEPNSTSEINDVVDYIGGGDLERNTFDSSDYVAQYSIVNGKYYEFRDSVWCLPIGHDNFSYNGTNIQDDKLFLVNLSKYTDMMNAYNKSLVDKEKFDNKTSDEWVTYKAQCQQIDDDYNAKMAQYNQDLEQYNSDMRAYDTAYDAYIKNLENGVGITYKEDDSAKLYQCTHLIIGNLDKYDRWTGGIYFSGSATRYMMKTCWKVYEDTDESDQYILPVLSSGSYSNTFLRIDIDEAPSDKRGNIYWASSGTDNITGKKLSLPIRVKSQAGNGKIPHYQYLQSQERLDWGRDINTLNCITVNMPIYFSVIVDPDAMDLYAACGAANGIYFISTLNTQTSYTYEIQYPDSNIRCETFPMGKRRGYYGFDGISIYQEEEKSGSDSKTEDGGD